MSDFDVTSITNPDGSIQIHMHGDLDLASAESFNQTLMAAERSDAPAIYLDLSGLGFMDSTGLRLILQANGRARQRSARLILVAGRESVQRVFSVTGMQERLEFVDSMPGPQAPARS